MLVRVCLLSAFCAVAYPAAAAQCATDHTVEGIVRDTTGAVLIAADVTLASSNGGDSRTTVTDTSGHFRFGGLPDGVYRVAASAAGFGEAAQTVRFGDEQVAFVELSLQLVVAEHVEVSSNMPLSASTGLSQTTLTGTALEALPDDPGGLLQRVRELAGATDSAGQVLVTVDGFRQLQWLPPKQAIQAIRIASNWFAPEFAEPGQARIDIITKPGLSRVHGDVTANFNDEAMNARNPLAPNHPSGKMHEVTGYLSGPVIPRRWSFVVYRGYWAQHENRVINATVLDPTHKADSYVDSVAAPSRLDNLWLGSTYQVAPLHTLALSFSGTTDGADNLGLESGLDLPERAYQKTATTRILRATVTSVPSTRLLNEVRLQVNPQRSAVHAKSSSPAVIVFDSFNGGGNQESLFVATRHIEAELVDSVTLFLPHHTLKAGISARSARRQYTDASNAGGVFVFGADFNRDAAGVPIEDGEGDNVLISPLENYSRTLLGLAGHGPAQFWMTRGNPDVRFVESSVGVFAQDDWIAAPRVTLSYGLRSETQTAASDAVLGLRAGLAVALDSARKNVIRAGGGSFYQRIDPELTLDVIRFDGHHQEQVLVGRPSFFPTVPADIAGSAAALPTIYASDPELRTPAILMSAASYERELTGATFLSVKYSYQRGTDLLRTRNTNAPDVSGMRPDARFAQVLQYESTGRLRRHELTSGWRWNGGGRGSLFANYSYVHARSDTDGRTTMPADGSRLDQEFGAAAADRTHVATMGANFTLPSRLFVSPYLTAASGRVFNLTTGLDNNGDGVFADRPAMVAPGTPGAIQTPYGTLLANPAADAVIAPRNVGHDPAAVRLDLRVARTFHPWIGGSFVLAANIENVFNRANYEGVNGVITSPSFGQPNRAAAPRRINLAANFNF